MAKHLYISLCVLLAAANTLTNTLNITNCVKTYSLHPIISALLEFKIYPKISAHLNIRQTNFTCVFLLSLTPRCNDYTFIGSYM